MPNRNVMVYLCRTRYDLVATTAILIIMPIDHCYNYIEIKTSQMKKATKAAMNYLYVENNSDS